MGWGWLVAWLVGLASDVDFRTDWSGFEDCFLANSGAPRGIEVVAGGWIVAAEDLLADLCHDMSWGPASEVINDVDKDRIPLIQIRYIFRKIQSTMLNENKIQNENRSGFSHSTDSSWQLIGSQKPLWTNKLSAKPKLNTDWISLRVRYPIRDISYLVTLVPEYMTMYWKKSWQNLVKSIRCTLYELIIS